ncbi:MAG: dockerin type I domain-containing protein, partial [Candidatus Zixiibacteriota bacterium]
DRSIVFTAHKIDAGTDANAKAEFTMVEVLAPTGLAEMQALVDTARAIVARERAQGGMPALCGDVQGDAVVNVGDVVYLVSYLFKGGPAPYCPQARADCNSDGVPDVADVITLVDFLYRGDVAPVCPGILYW